jgi:hypothetical protein
MNEYFSKTIISGGIEREFQFMKVFYASGSQYHIRFILDNTPKEFKMDKDENGKWKIGKHDLPDWIFESETDFNNAIEENNKR